MLRLSEPTTLSSSSNTKSELMKKKAKKIVMRARMKKLHKREYSKLRAMVPAVAKQEKVSKITVIEEAIKYIDELHNALIERLQNNNNNQSQSATLSHSNSNSSSSQTGSPSQTEINQRMLHEVVMRNLAPLNSLKQNPVCEKSRKLPSYLTNQKLSRADHT
ncbi:uncharacterized protein LOC141912780 [Tubulanus polymorphus]|uniref:uncharacterized protein LOC141912780 n=1 Tax=Tubulanus polymorphus TaxID=672921 RepID=UPI003DA5D043